MELAELHIDKMPADRGTVLDDIQILRGKKHKIRDAKQLARLADWDAVDGDTFRFIFSGACQSQSEHCFVPPSCAGAIPPPETG